MAGNPDNAILWDSADVYSLKPSAITGNQTIADLLPELSTDPFPDAWDLVGLLNGDDGFGEEREWDETDHSAWGYGVIKVGSRNFAMTRTFTALEPENETNSYLYSPGDTATKVIVAKPAQVYLAFEVIGDDGRIERRITSRPSRVTAPSKNQNEADLASLEFSARIFPNNAKELFLKQNAATDLLVGP
ncbi:major tail protein [Gordonia phage Santhid]|uniref:Major tail protein n=1 Tax=Gordonia phage Santhid TaxID=2927281 RepID=A0AAE9GLR0_9CAUD|nr:major tail protein [Gordonia phage Santhid]UOK18008.1 major tail protein [Gordonia phage Santhid]